MKVGIHNNTNWDKRKKKCVDNNKLIHIASVHALYVSDNSKRKEMK